MVETLHLIGQALRELTLVYLRSPDFYLQLLLFAVLVALAWLLARLLRRGQRQLPGWHLQQWLTPFYFPLLGLISGRLIEAALEVTGERFTIFSRLYALFWVLLLFRLAVAAVRRFSPRNAELIRRRILLPLALLFVTLRLVGQLGLFFQVLNQPLFIIAEGTPQQLAISLPLLVLGPLAILAIYAVAQGLRTVLTEDLLPGAGLSAPRAYAIGTLVSYAAIVVGTLMALAALGVNPTSLTVLSSALAVGAGFGLQNTVNNFVSGFLIMFDPLVNVGDTVEITNERGVIRYIGIRNSVIETVDGTRVVVPNATLSSSPLLNLNQSTRPTKVVLTLPIAHGADPRQVTEALLTILRQHPAVRDTPEPTVALLRLEAAALFFEVTFWAATAAQKGATTHDVNVAIWEALQRLGYELAPAAAPAPQP